MSKKKKKISTKEIVEKIEESKGKCILLPLISKKENDPAFIDKAIEGLKRIILLMVIDTETMPGGFGFAASEIGQGNQLMMDVKTLLKEKGINAEEILEWGNTETKIDHVARLREVKKIVLKKQDNHYFKKLVKSLKDKKLNVEVIA